MRFSTAVASTAFLWLHSFLVQTVSGQFETFEEVQFWDDNDNGDVDPDLPSCGEPMYSDVTIVGAGLAGLFAAAVLGKKGYSYRLVEAEDVPGGRLRAISLFDGTVEAEVGAQFMYGFGNGYGLNPMYGLFEKYGVDYYEYPYTADFIVYHRDGRPYPDKKVKYVLEDLKLKLRDCIGYYADFLNFNETIPESEDVDIDKFSTVEKVLKTDCGAKGYRVTSDLRDAVAHAYLEQEHLKELKDITLIGNYPEDSYFDFDYRLFVQTTSSTAMVEAFIDDNINEDWLHLNSEVTKVRHAGRRGQAKVVAKRTVGGTQCLQKYRSEVVISTMNNKIHFEEARSGFFTPPLRGTRDAPLTMNIAEKVWLRFDSVWWNNTVPFFLIANKQEEGQATLFFNYELIKPGTKMLMCFVGVELLKGLPGQVLNEATIRSNVMNGLRNLTGFQEPSAVEYSDWANNPYFRGSWETWQRGFDYNNFDAAEEFYRQARLFLSGAGHCDRYWGFTWGAIFHGILTAEYIDCYWFKEDEECFPKNPCNDGGYIYEGEWKQLWSNYDFFPVPQDTKSASATT